MKTAPFFSLIASTICAFGCASMPRVEASDQRERWIEAYVAKYREEACGTHWVGNPSFTDCMAALRREAVEKHPAPDLPRSGNP
jgi:hypothetical protein